MVFRQKHSVISMSSCPPPRPPISISEPRKLESSGGRRRICPRFPAGLQRAPHGGQRGALGFGFGTWLVKLPGLGFGLWTEKPMMDWDLPFQNSKMSTGTSQPASNLDRGQNFPSLPAFPTQDWEHEVISSTTQPVPADSHSSR